MSVFLFFAIFSYRDIGIRQNWARKQEVGHCDLILQPIFFNLISLKSKVQLMLHTKHQPTNHAILEKKLILLVLLFLALAAILDSRPSKIL